MSIPILATKLFIPPPQTNGVLRPRLIEQLNQGSQDKLTLISAPAGFGKTTLLSQWLVNCDRPTTWLSLDEKDNDPTRFLRYLIASLQVVNASFGAGVLAGLQSPQPPPIELILTTLINEIADIENKFILVLDDYHVIDAKPVNDIISFLLEHLTSPTRLIISSREDPHLPLARLRVRGQLTELRAADLRFSSMEAAEFLNQMMDTKLSMEDVVALESRTEGWIASLQLAAISMRGHKDKTNFIKSFTGSHHFVMDYLVEEVLQQQPEHVQRFLMQTAVLDRFCGPLCDAVFKDNSASGQKILDYIKSANLFVIPLDNERHWFRYHHLFADLLKQRSAQNFTLSNQNEPTLTTLHLRASRWFEDHNLKVEAFYHTIAAKDFERAAELIERVWPEMERSFQTATWLEMVKLMPEDLIETRPVITAGYGLALMTCGDYQAGQAKLKDAERCLNANINQSGSNKITPSPMVVIDNEQFRSLPASIATTRVYHALALDNATDAVKYAQQALRLLPKEDHIRRGVAAGLLACSYWANGNLDIANQTFVEVKSGHETAGSHHFAIAITIGLAGIKVSQGELQAAKSLYEESINQALRQDIFAPAVAADLLLGLSMLQLEQGDFEAAQQQLTKSKELGDQTALSDWKYCWFIAQARIKEAQDDLENALDLLQKAESVFFNTPRPNFHPISAKKTRIWIRQSRLSEAMAWVDDQELSTDDDLNYLQEFEHITLVRVLLARYQSDQSIDLLLKAADLLDRLLIAAEIGSRKGSLIEILLLKAQVYKARDEENLAFTTLKHALVLAEPEDYVQVFVSEGPFMENLLSEVSTQGIKSDYVNMLLSIIKAEKRFKKNKSELPTNPFAQPLIEPLSKRELEILRLIDRGLSNREICDSLFLALTTVKGHNSNIFGKLQVKSRTEAIVRARQLNLL